MESEDIYELVYEATKQAIVAAMAGKPTSNTRHAAKTGVDFPVLANLSWLQRRTTYESATAAANPAAIAEPPVSNEIEGR